MNLFKKFVPTSVISSVFIVASGCAIDPQSRPLGGTHPASPSAASARGMAQPFLMTNLAVFTSRPATANGTQGHEGHKGHEGGHQVDQGHKDHGSHNHGEAE